MTKKKSNPKHEVGQLREPEGFVKNTGMFGNGFIGHMDRMNKAKYGKPFVNYDNIEKSLKKKCDHTLPRLEDIDKRLDIDFGEVDD